ncbi:hypothetical protein EDD22DRAFT_995522 [Suillus occidentalis]|nr:hypothetical protein EDD22DRAFT_995522 [Suillus occidentalis]
MPSASSLANDPAKSVVSCTAHVPVEAVAKVSIMQAHIFRNNVCIFVRQSGETADSILALWYYSLGEVEYGVLSVRVVDAADSTISYETYYDIHIDADCAIIKRVYRVAHSLATFNITLGFNFPIKPLVLKLLDELESVSDQSFGIHDMQQLINYPANVVKVRSV